MSFSAIFMAMFKLFLILLIGFGCQKLGVFPDGTQDALSKAVIYVAMPGMILNSVMSNTSLPDASTILYLLGLSFAIYAVMLVVFYFVAPLIGAKPGQRGVYACMLVFSNAGFIGYPVVEAVFGSNAILYAAIFNIAFYPALFAPGTLMLMKDGQINHPECENAKLKLSSIFLNPSLISSVVAIILAITRLQMPSFISSTCASLGAMTAPGCLLVIGIMIAQQPYSKMLGSPKVWLVTVLRLIACPALMWLLFLFLIPEETLRGIITILFAMPVASTVPLLAEEYGSDSLSAVQSVFLTTALSMITIPIMMLILH